MPKMTKAQQKRLAKSILSKAKKLWVIESASSIITTKDLVAIEAIVKRILKRLG